MSSNLGRQPDPRRGSHSRARLEVPRPNHGLTTVVTINESIVSSGNPPRDAEERLGSIFPFRA
jgi:hypothetical protein